MARLIDWLANVGVTKSNGDPVALGSLYFYTPGTTVQTAVYGDSERLTTLSQPVTTDGYGRATVYTEGIVKMLVQDGELNTVNTWERANAQAAEEVEVRNSSWSGLLSDGSTGAGGLTTLEAALTSIGTSIGGTDGQFLSAVGGSARGVAAALTELGMSVKSFGAVGDGVTMDTTAFKAAIAALTASGSPCRRLIIPPGTYLIDDVLLIPAYMEILGQGGASITQTSATKGGLQFTSTAGSIRGLGLTGTTSAGTGMLIGGAGELIGCTVSGFTTAASVGSLSVVMGCLFAVVGSTDTCVSAASGSRIIGNNMSGGVGVAAASAVMIIGNNISSTTGISGASTDTVISGNSITGSTTALTSSTPVIGDNYSTSVFSNTIATLTPSSATITINSAARFYEIAVAAATVSLITKAGAVPGRSFTLKFNGAVTVTHNAAPGATTAAILLAGAANFSATADDTLTLVYNGTSFYEVSRAVI